MVAFATLLLGLVVGEVRVDLLVTDAVAAVEVRLDGTPCGRRDAAPWSIDCDLGEELSPHRLEAIAFDAAGAEVGRAEQHLNVGRRDASISLLLDRDPHSGASTLRIATASAAANAPRTILVSLDGVAMPTGDGALVGLPELDFAEPHLLRVEAQWTDRVSAAVDAVIGGEHGGELATELTAVPVSVSGSGRGTPRAAELAGSIRAGGRPVRVAAVDRGPGELWVVADPRWLPLLARRTPSSTRSSRVGGIDWRQIGVLGHGDDVRLVWPWPERRVVDGRAHDLFLPLPAMPARSAGIPWLLYHARLPPLGEGPPHLVDATAVAGMALAATERRRAILVLLDGEARMQGQITPATARRYLDRLRVPSFVWRLERWRGPGPDPWGPARRIANGRELLLALDELMESLREQRIAWIDGSYLPTELEIVDRDEAFAERAAADPRSDEAAATEPLEAPEEGDDPAVAEARQRARERRIAALEAAVAGGLRGSAAGVELRLASGVELSIGAFERAVELGVSRWRRDIGIDLPQLDSTVLAVVARFDQHSGLAREVAGLDARGHAGFGVAVLEAREHAADDVEALAMHELSHLLAERVFLRSLPIWLEEGLAEHVARRRLAPTAAQAKRRGGIEIERSERGIATHANGPLADLLMLARASERDELTPLASWTGLSWREFVDPESRALHYALAGELVGFLLDAASGRSAGFRSVLARAAAEPDFDLAAEMAAALGDAAVLDEAFRAWLRAERDGVLEEVGLPTARD